MSQEQCKPINGYDGIYEVSNTGKVKSLARTVFSATRIGKGSKRSLPERILKQDKSGKYPAVGLHSANKVKKYTIHRLVLDAFVDNPKRLPEVNHKDGNKYNNDFSNLEPSTRQHNCQHAVETGLLKIRGRDNYFAKLDQTDVEMIRSRFTNGETQTQIAKATGFLLANVHCIVRRKSWKHI